MNISVPKGTYVVAVSGGVDSMCLLHMLMAYKTPQHAYVVAHAHHGIRDDADQDEALVRNTAEQLGLPYEVGYLQLGKQASEEAARATRYIFLRAIAKKYKAQAIITAHHKDDIVETILLHVQRGTGRSGLTPMTAQDVLRPLLNIPKSDLLLYAKKHTIAWYEDSTNKNDRYARNKIRHLLCQKDAHSITDKVYALYEQMLPINNEIDELVTELYNSVNKNMSLKRSQFVVLPYAVQKEIVHMWLKNASIPNINKVMIERATVACKILRPGKKMSLEHNRFLVSARQSVKIL